MRALHINLALVFIFVNLFIFDVINFLLEPVSLNSSFVSEGNPNIINMWFLIPAIAEFFKTTDISSTTVPLSIKLRILWFPDSTPHIIYLHPDLSKNDLIFVRP